MLKGLAVAIGACGAIFIAPAAQAQSTEPAKIVQSAKGKVYADEKGMTLYIFDKDPKGKSNCAGECATYWPPFKATGASKDSDEWSVIARDDGSKQWAYDGKPLYTYVKDIKPGDVSGDGVGGTWHLAKP